MTNTQNYEQIRDLASKHLNQYVTAELEDGTRFNGVVTGLDEQYVYLDVPPAAYPAEAGGYEGYEERSDDERQFGWGPRFRPRPFGFYGYRPPFYGGGYPFYPGFGGYGFGGGFGRLVLPFAALTALSALPWY